MRDGTAPQTDPPARLVDGVGRGGRRRPVEFAGRLRLVGARLSGGAGDGWELVAAVKDGGVGLVHAQDGSEVAGRAG